MNDVMQVLLAVASQGPAWVTAGGLIMTGVVGILNYRHSRRIEAQQNVALAQQNVALAQQKLTHDLVNSQSEALLSLTRTTSRAEGKAEGKAEGIAEQQEEQAPA